MDKRSRSWCLTVFNDMEKHKNTLTTMNYEYLIMGKEICPTTKKLHLQCYIRLKNAITFRSMSKKVPKVSIRIANGTDEENRKYCSKDGDYEEYGSLAHPGKRTDIDKVKELVKETSKMSVVVEQASSLQSVRFAEIYLKYNEKPRTWKPHVQWVFGPTGLGKTKWANETLPNAYWNMSNMKWWDGYDGQEEVIIDELRPDTCKLDYLLRLLDRYPFKIECKGGSRQFLAKNIIITSCYSIEEWCFLNNSIEDWHQLARRVDICFYANLIKSDTEVGGNTKPLPNLDDLDFDNWLNN